MIQRPITQGHTATLRGGDVDRQRLTAAGIGGAMEVTALDGVEGDQVGRTQLVVRYVVSEETGLMIDKATDGRVFVSWFTHRPRP